MQRRNRRAVAALLCVLLPVAAAGCSRAAERREAPEAGNRDVVADVLREAPLGTLLPGGLGGGWNATGDATSYGAGDLHLLVDGGDEVFIRYGVQGAVRRTYARDQAEETRIVIELYRFASPDGALGRYGHEAIEAGPSWTDKPAPGPLAGIVDAARLDVDQLRMARGRHLAILRFEDDAQTDLEKLATEAEGPLVTLAAALARLVDEATRPPKARRGKVTATATATATAAATATATATATAAATATAGGGDGGGP